MNALYWCVIYLFDLGKLGFILFYLLALPMKRKPAAVAGLLALGAGLIALAALLVGNGKLFMLVFWLVGGLVMAALLGSWKRALLVAPLYLLLSVVDNLLANLILWATGSVTPPFAQSSAFYLTLNFYILLCELSLLGLLAWVAEKYRARPALALNRRHVGVISLGLLVLLGVTMLVQHEMAGADSAQAYLLGAVAPVLFFVVYLVVSMLVLLVGTRAERYKAESDANAQLVEWQKKYYRALLEKEQDTRQFRHDIQHHIHYLRSMAQMGRWEQIEPYLDTLTGSVQVLGRVVETGNETINCVAAEVFSWPEAQGVELVWRGRYPEGGAIAEMDLCVLFANLLVNAVEAAAQCEGHRRVEAEVRTTDRHLYITVANPVCGPVDIVGNELKTSKQDAAGHGFGTQSVRRIAQSYGGEAVFACVEGRFTCELFFLNLLAEPNG